MISKPAVFWLCFGFIALYIVLIFFSMYPDTMPYRRLLEYDLFYNTTRLQNEDDPLLHCELPNYDPWDDEINKYVKLDWSPQDKCQQNIFPQTKFENGIVSRLKNVTNKNLVCSARCHERKDEYHNNVGKWKPLGEKMNCEIVEAVCWNKKNVTEYGRLHTQIIKTSSKPSKLNPDQNKQFNVYVILIDSTAYSQSRRALPRTLSYFENSMQAVAFPYLNKVGDNSRPNGIALWFGKQMEKIDRTLFGEGIIEPDWTNNDFCNNFVDNHTFLLTEYGKYGYKTLLAEDWSKGTVNWPNCKGFKDQPTDHYMRPYQLASESGERITKQMMCEESHHQILEYVDQFSSAYPKDPKIAFIWITRLSHNDENTLTHADKDFHHYFHRNRALLDNSFVFLMGDHGLRFGSVKGTRLGALDVNNPMLYISIPRELRRSTNLLRTLEENAQKLQTHYDTRATLLDILKFQPSVNFQNNSYLQIDNEKGSSLLRNQKNEPRSCRSLPIPMEYCICQFNKTTVDEKSQLSKKLGVFVTDEINKRLTEGGFNKTICSPFKFEKTYKLERYEQPLGDGILYSVNILMTKPSEAKFKANIRVNNDGSLSALGTISRENSYGRTADCIHSHAHRPLCYCAKNLKKP